ncbi:MAG: hypothetical protein KatS3mg008_2010 [Acidimicrobiales bacterium]|nr:MAG: hypothetical protein KatS3mg008_2010 [Acidimicrobiales bacterium]
MSAESGREAEGEIAGEVSTTARGPTAEGARSAAVVAAGIFLSRVSGLVREMVLAGFLATGVAADAFRAAIRIPNLLQNLLGEGSLSAAFIPVYSRMRAEGREQDAGRLAGAVAGLLAAVAALLVLVALFAAEPLTAILAPGFSGRAHELTVDFVRIATAGVGALVLSAWCLGILNSHGRFFLPYVAPVVWNLAQVAAVVAAAVAHWTEADLATAACWGVLVGGFAQFLVQLPSVLRVERCLVVSPSTRAPGVRDVLRRFGPAVLGRGTVQVMAYVDLVLASLLAVGAVAALGYAQVLYMLPISLFAMSVAAAELPALSATPRSLGVCGTRVGRGLAGVLLHASHRRLLRAGR